MGRKKKRRAALPSAPPQAPFKARGRRVLAALAALAAIAGGVAWVVRSHVRSRPNLLLVTIDTLRADHVGVYGYAGANTPVLDGLAGRGTRFENAESAVPLTGPSHATILTGMYPPVHGVRDNVTFLLDPRHATLATLLKKRGYRTAAFVAAYPVAASFGFRQGFDDFDEGFHESPAPGQGAERPGNEVADAVIRWIESRASRPFFLWAHFYDPHAPYAPPPPFADAFKDRPYDGEIAFADQQLGRVLEALRAAGHADDTVVIVLADHGEALGDHGEATHAILIYQSTLRVPLILAGPGVPAGKIVADRVGTVDVLPTALALLAESVPEGLPGRSLKPALEGNRLPPEPLYAESLFGRINCRWSRLRGWVLGDWKLIEGVEPELYDLASDPDETQDRAHETPDRVRRMQGALAAALQRMAPGGDSTRPTRISPEQEERLRSLGYAGGAGRVGDVDKAGLPDPRTHVHLFERLQAAMTAGGPESLARAAEEAASIAAQDPGNPFAHFTLASIAYRSTHFKLAEQAFARTLELDPDWPGMRHYYGRLLREIGKLEESERQLRIGLEQAGADDIRVRVNLCVTLIARGKLDEAEQLLKEALSREPHHIEALGAMGRLLVARGNAKDAIPYLEQAARERGVEPLIELALAHLAAGDAGRAREAAGEALGRDSNHPWALAVMGHALVAEGRRAEGVVLLQKALALRPRRHAVWLSLARAFEAAGNSPKAALCRREAATIAGS